MAILVQENVTKLSCYFQMIQVAGIFSCSDDNVVALWEQLFVQTEGFPDEPFEPVSLDCIPDPLAYSNPQPCDSPSVLHQRDCEVLGTKFSAESI